MKTLSNLRPNKGSNVRKKRLGRGIGSGLGKTSGKGHKGQKARKSSDVPAGFEGGQVPLYRRLPKRGFYNQFEVKYQIVNISSLAKLKTDGKVGAKDLKDAGLIKNLNIPVKILGRGEISNKIHILVNKASAKAKELIEKAGGKVEILES